MLGFEREPDETMLHAHESQREEEKGGEGGGGGMALFKRDGMNVYWS